MITERKTAEKRSNEQYYFMKKYDVLEINNIQRVILKRHADDDPIIYIIPIEEYYEKLLECHLSTGHGGRDKMLHSIKKKYNIPRTAIEIILRLLWCRRNKTG